MATLVLLIGAPRSGTTWVQQILASHPAVVSPPETELFSRYLGPAVATWDRSLDRDEGAPSPRRLKGLPTVLDDDEFIGWTRDLVERTVTRCVAMKPGATVVVEKTPAHSLFVDVIERCAPQSHYVHLVRDGRDVSDSLIAAGRGWGYRWAPTTIGGAAAMWREHVDGALAAAERVGPRAQELRYETVRSGDAQSIVDVFAHCGLSVTVDEAAGLIEANTLTHDAAPHDAASSLSVGGMLSGRAIDEPQGFVRSGEIGAWRRTWSATDRATFAARAGDRLVSLGYEPDSAWVGRVSPAIRARAAAIKVALRVSRRCASWAEHAREQVP